VYRACADARQSPAPPAPGASVRARVRACARACVRVHACAAACLRVLHPNLHPGRLRLRGHQLRFDLAEPRGGRLVLLPQLVKVTLQPVLHLRHRLVPAAPSRVRARVRTPMPRARLHRREVPVLVAVVRAVLRLRLRHRHRRAAPLRRALAAPKRHARTVGAEILRHNRVLVVVRALPHNLPRRLVQKAALPFASLPTPDSRFPIPDS
jgi:hypothetical protein